MHLGFTLWKVEGHQESRIILIRALMEGGKWRVVGLGFNGFCQLNFPGTDKKAEPRAETASTELTDQELRVTSPRVLLELTSPPSRVRISSAWDSLHMFVEGVEGARSVATGRWLHPLDEVKRRLREGETVMEVVETRRGHLLLSTTLSRRLLALSDADGAVQVEEWSPPHPVLEVSALEDGQIFALFSSGKLYRCSIDPPDSCKLVLGPEVPLGRHTISHMCCGADHTLLLTQNGSLLSFGLGSRGQLGHGDILPRPEPCLVSALAGLPVKAAACGSWHCLALSECGDVYSWGWNKDGQLGLRQSAGLTVTTPTLVDSGTNAGDIDVSFVSISCGSRHSAALTEAGVLYSWGWNDHGQLGDSAVGGSHWRTVYSSYWNTFLIQ